MKGKERTPKFTYMHITVTNVSLPTSSTSLSFLHHQYLANPEYLISSSPVTSEFNTHDPEYFFSMYRANLDRITWLNILYEVYECISLTVQYSLIVESPTSNKYLHSILLMPWTTKLEQVCLDAVYKRMCVTGTQMALVCVYLTVVTVTLTKLQSNCPHKIIHRKGSTILYIKHADDYSNKFLGLWLNSNFAYVSWM